MKVDYRTMLQVDSKNEKKHHLSSLSVDKNLTDQDGRYFNFIVEMCIRHT